MAEKVHWAILAMEAENIPSDMEVGREGGAQKQLKHQERGVHTQCAVYGVVKAAVTLEGVG